MGDCNGVPEGLSKQCGGALHMRDMTADDIEAVAKLWWRSWHAAHRHLLPDQLVRQRTLKSFTSRAASLVGSTRLAPTAGRPKGFYATHENQVQLLYVAPEFWRSGVGSRLLWDAAAALARQSLKTAWLDCYAGNTRAANFYERLGWRRTTTFLEEHADEGGRLPVLLKAWKFETQLHLENVVR